MSSIMILTLEGYLTFLHLTFLHFFFFFLQYHRDITSFHYHWSFFTDRQRLWPTFFLLFHRKKRRIDKIAIWRFISRILVLIILPIEWSLLEQTKDAPDVFKRNPCFCNCNCKCNRIYFRSHRNAIRSFQDNNFYFIKTSTSMKTFIFPHHPIFDISSKASLEIFTIIATYMHLSHISLSWSPIFNF